ncbi:pyruvate dehydrogenase (acetyl-transferring) E1 component subunit alpha [Halobacteriales archaeon QS_4_69_34]|nr:MAG: pyruvate dehydrogenase (acetyl-transferring) E1 component subunit alpha [Halobacteriales archaeon QS_4_69_34]
MDDARVHSVLGERDLGETPFDADDARALLTDMLRARAFDERALALQRRGWMSGYPPFRGQEAVQVGAARALEEGDWLFPTYRSNALQVARGVPMSDLLAFRRGHPEYVSDHAIPNFPQAVPIATQLPHAVGAGMAAARRAAEHAVLCDFGDGATSEGDFHEALNFSGVFDAPVVFLCENNGWAISLPRKRQTASATIAGKAAAYGIEGVRVDGNDPLAACEVVGEALDRARDGEPTLIEALTYRQGAHTTSDDPGRYRRDDPDLPAWRARDPVERFVEYLDERGIIGEEFVANARETADAELDEAIERAEAITESGPGELFEHVYATLPPALERQRETLRADDG